MFRCSLVPSQSFVLDFYPFLVRELSDDDFMNDSFTHLIALYEDREDNEPDDGSRVTP